jgi:hypothetical protein
VGEREGEEREEYKEEVERRQTKLAGPTFTSTELEEDFEDGKWVTLNFTTYTELELSRYGGSLNCIGFEDTDRRDEEFCHSLPNHTLHS